MNKHLKILGKSQQYLKKKSRRGSKCSFTASFCGFWISMGSTSHPSTFLSTTARLGTHEAATFLLSQILTFKSSQISTYTKTIHFIHFTKKGLIEKTQYGCELRRSITKSLHCSYFHSFGAGDSFSVALELVPALGFPRQPHCSSALFCSSIMIKALHHQLKHFTPLQTHMSACYTMRDKSVLSKPFIGFNKS